MPSWASPAAPSFSTWCFRAEPVAPRLHAAPRAVSRDGSAGRAARVGGSAALAPLRARSAAGVRAAQRGARLPVLPASAGGAARLSRLLRAGAALHSGAAAAGGLAGGRGGRAAGDQHGPGRAGFLAARPGRLAAVARGGGGILAAAGAPPALAGFSLDLRRRTPGSLRRGAGAGGRGARDGILLAA